MKKFAKAALITAGILFFTGVIILIICSIFAGTAYRGTLSDTVSSQLHRIAQNGFLHIDGHSSHYSFDSSYPIYSGKHTDYNAACADDITELYLDLGNTIFILSPSQDNYFHIISDGTGEYQYYAIGSSFYIDGFSDRKVHQKNQLTLEIPDKTYKYFSISLGAGAAELSSIKSDAVVISVGAGELTLDSLSCKSIDAEIGAGAASIENAATELANFEVSMGELIFEGCINADMSAEVGMGNMELLLTGSQRDHNYELEAGMGGITIDQRSYGGIAFDTALDNGADSTYSLECSMGNITVTFNGI